MHSGNDMTFEEYKMGVIRHEIGHWLMAEHLNFNRGGITIKIIDTHSTRAHSGSATIYPMHSLTSHESIIKYLEDRISILFSGVIAQLLFEVDQSSKRSEELLDEYGADDNGKIEELTHIVRGITRAGTMSVENELDHKKEIREKCWKVAAIHIEKSKTILEKMSSSVAKKTVRANIKYEISFDQLNEFFTCARNNNA